MEILAALDVLEQAGGVTDAGLWVEILKYGVGAVIVVAGLRGLFVYRWTYDAVTTMLQTQIDEEKARTADEREQREQAQRDTVAMRNMLFESLGISRAAIEKVDASLPSARPSAGTPP